MNKTCTPGKILIVEDNPVNLELFLDILEMAGYHCFGAMNGKEAILLAQKEIPDLILLDIQLPEMDGFAVMDNLRAMATTKHITTVALTAYAMKGDREIFINRKFDGYIPKPVSVQELLDIVAEHMKTPRSCCPGIDRQPPPH
jgi:two-component system, cell cycle response regulator DivK